MITNVIDVWSDPRLPEPVKRFLVAVRDVHGLPASDDPILRDDGLRLLQALVSAAPSAGMSIISQQREGAFALLRAAVAKANAEGIFVSYQVITEANTKAEWDMQSIFYLKRAIEAWGNATSECAEIE